MFDRWKPSVLEVWLTSILTVYWFTVGVLRLAPQAHPSLAWGLADLGLGVAGLIRLALILRLRRRASRPQAADDEQATREGTDPRFTG